jgi:hypothetical protein
MEMEQLHNDDHCAKVKYKYFCSVKCNQLFPLLSVREKKNYPLNRVT